MNDNEFSKQQNTDIENSVNSQEIKNTEIINQNSVNNQQPTQSNKFVLGILVGCGSSLLLAIVLIFFIVAIIFVSTPSKAKNKQTSSAVSSVSSLASSALSTDTSSDDTDSDTETTKEESKKETSAVSSKTTSSENSSKEESKKEPLSKEEYINLVKESISKDLEEGEKYTDISIDGTNLHIGVDLSGAKINPKYIITEEDLAVDRASRITDTILTLDRTLWDSITLDFENLGTITRKKSEIVTTAYGSYFEIDYLDTYKKSSSSAVSENNDFQEQVIFNNNGIVITYLGIGKGWMGDCVNLKIENHSGKNYTLQTRNTSVNDIMIHDIFSCSVADGKKTNSKIQFLSSDFEENGISEINNIEFSFHIFNTDDWLDSFDTVTIVINP